MLRHLGAAYYESLHGRATHADVTRALDTVEEHLHEESTRQDAAPAEVPAPRPPQADAVNPHGLHDDATGRPGGWAHRVGDVMTTSVVTVDRITPFKEIVHLLAEHRISGVPVLSMGRHVAGVVTEQDLLVAQELRSRRMHMAAHPAWWHHRPPRTALTAGDLMSAPAVTIGPDATVLAAARLLDAHHLRRLPVVDDAGRLLGVVSRRDLLSVFLRPDEDIAADARQVLDDVRLTEPGDVNVTVRNGIVTLTGTVRPSFGELDDLIPLTMRLMWDVDGVVDIVDRIGEKKEEGEGPTAPLRQADS
jgi:CBS domain-containing protein